MRIKWNRHLDGSASRQGEDESPSQETDEKKKTASSSQSIFKIFRRKKKSRRTEEDEKTGGHPDTGLVSQEEAVDDECASMSSIATCASQPVSDGFKRDRASSLFSSFRLSLPGSKRKKRRIAPAPSDTILNGQQQQQNEPQAERYSTPDLRKPSDKLVVPSDQPVTHSTSSPSIRNPKGASTSAHSLDDQNSESLDKLKLNGAKSTSSTKLSKSVSFSGCKGGPIDSPHSKCDNRDPRAVNSAAAMVEENCGAVESELPTCMSDNLQERNFTSFAYSSANESRALPRRQNRPSDALVDTVEMTKTEVVASGAIQDCSLSRIDDILSDIASEIRSYDKDSGGVGTPPASSFNCDSRSHLGGCDNEVVADVQERTHNERYAVRVNLVTSPGVHHVEETGSVTSPVPEWNTICEPFDNNKCDVVLPGEVNKNTTYHYDSNQLQSEVPFNRNLHLSSVAKLPIVVPTKIVSSNSRESAQNRDLNVDDIVCDLGKSIQSDRIVVEKQDDTVSQTAIGKDKHVVCHMKVCYDGRGKSKSDDAICEKSYSSEDSPTKSLCEKFVQKMHSIDNSINSFSSNSVDSENIQHTCLSTQTSSSISQNHSSFLMTPSNEHASCRINSSLNQSDFDQKVPDLSRYNNNFKNDHEVPEFELSLLEFEEMCDKYMSGKNVPFSDCASVISHFSNSPRRKSVLDLNQPFIFSPFRENGDSKIHLNNAKECSNSALSTYSESPTTRSIEICSDLKPPDLSPTDKFPLPLPPKQWISCRKPIENERNRDVCIDREQCTAVRGKNLCQEPSLEAFPTTVMHGEADSGVIDTPQLSSTLETFGNKSGRECSSIDIAEKQQVSDGPTPPEDMVSDFGTTLVSNVCVIPPENRMAKVGLTISNLNTVLDYSCAETPVKDSVYLDPEIRNTFRLQRGICDPLIYSAEGTKGLEALGSENYLIGHNFADIRNVGLCEVISEASRDSAQSRSGLIEISNPYEDESFVVPREIFSSNLINGLNASIQSGDDRLRNGCDLKCSSDVSAVRDNTGPRSIANEEKETLSKIESKISCEENVSCSNDLRKTIINGKKNKPLAFVVNGNGLLKENKLSYSKQKNLINKNKSSMIPCRKKGPHVIEIKRPETKPKSKKADTIPRLNNNESLPVKNNTSLRDLSECYKDSDVGYIGKQKSHSFVKIGGKPNLSPVTSLNSETGSEVNHSNSEETPGQDSGYYATGDSKLSRLFSRRTSELSNCSNFDSKSESSSITIDFDSSVDKNELDDSESVHSFVLITPEISSRFGFDDRNVLSSNCVKPYESNGAIPANHECDSKFVDEFYSGCALSNFNGERYAETPSECSESTTNTKSLDINLQSRRSSLPVVGMVKRSLASSKESLNSQLTNSSYIGKSRIPTKQPGSRGAQPSSKGPVRPPMWLSKAELTQEIQRLGTLCEARTKELNRLKMETKHVSVGFDAFAALFKYMVEDLNAMSVPNLTKDLEKTLKQLELTKQDLAFYEREVEEIKSHHCQELNDLSNKLFEVYQSEVAELNAKHQEEINHLKNDHQKQIEHITTTFDATSAEAKSHQEKMVASLEQEIINQRAELQLLQEREIRDMEEKHAEGNKMLQEHVEQLQRKCAELKQHSMSMEDAMRKDTDSKLQWVSSAKLDLEKEVESLKTVLEMKNKELHTLRVQNLEMEKQLEELPIAREKIKMLQARAEDLEALMIEKTKIERKLSTENQQMRDTYEKEAKVNRRLSMENEELQWRLRQAENSIISGSFSEVPEFPEAEENLASPTKSPGPQILSRSVFFTFMDKDESVPHSPRTQYKKITPNFSNNYKTSPAKSSKSPPAPSPQRRVKSHSEPPQPTIATSTPRKNAKLPLSKSKGSQKRQRCGSDMSRQVGELADGGSSSVADSMASSISSESSVFEHRERLLEEHREHIIHSLEILREQRNVEMSTDEVTMIEKKWRSDDIKVTGELSTLETEDMSRSAEFADPKTYYHMTFPVLKEAGDIEDGCKNPSSGNSPVKEVMSRAKHSKSVDNINSSIAPDVHIMSMSTQESSKNSFLGTDVQVMSMSTEEVSSTNGFIDANVQGMSISVQEASSAVKVSTKRSSCTELTVSGENVQNEDTSSNIANSQWRTI